MPNKQYDAANGERETVVESLANRKNDSPLLSQSTNDCSEAEQEKARIINYWSTAFACFV